MRLLFLGDVVGRPGRRALAAFLPRLMAREGIQFVIANGENASGGKGIDPRSAEELYDSGVDVDMHAEATSEKVGMGRFLDGKVSAVFGSHTHVQTADEGILPGGTAYLTDAGMCGPEDSVLGVKTEPVLQRFLTQMPARFDVATGTVIVQGGIVDVDEATGRASAIRRVRERVEV